MADTSPSIVDVLMGRHQHEPLMKITPEQRLYANYRLHRPSYDIEVETAGRHRNRPELEWDRGRVAEQLARDKV